MKRNCFGLWEVTLVLLVFVNITVDSARRHKKTPIWLNPCRAVEFRGGKARHQPTPGPHPLQLTGKGHRASPKTLRRLRTQVTVTYNHIASIMPNAAKLICNYF
ncbi:hypothetical protein GE061_007512 [Apolygus lucorum]|uniref:Uncharacterized protein n=1 Tax=Apolygus lucorum TaxID=248454 RepID=A0A8S9WUH8_APOLU|nr:hypothetical protein GE061_007512 [Apolygus lucorum]